MSERYTLDEARAVLAARECRDHGHDWRVIEERTLADPAGSPRHVVCDRCGKSYAVEVAP